MEFSGDSSKFMLAGRVAILKASLTLQLQVLLLEVGLSPVWTRMLEERKLVPGTLITAVRICLTELNRFQPLPSVSLLESALKRLAFPPIKGKCC